MIKIKKSKDGQYYTIIQARNGAILTCSETLRTKAGAIKNARAILAVLLPEQSATKRDKCIDISKL
jgi:uncharacterized protein YegP (UPF0339 family)